MKPDAPALYDDDSNNTHLNYDLSFELRIFTLHKRFDIGACSHAVFVHVLQSRKVVQHIEEYIVQKGVV